MTHKPGDRSIIPRITLIPRTLLTAERDQADTTHSSMFSHKASSIQGFATNISTLKALIKGNLTLASSSWGAEQQEGCSQRPNQHGTHVCFEWATWAKCGHRIPWHPHGYSGDLLISTQPHHGCEMLWYRQSQQAHVSQRLVAR